MVNGQYITYKAVIEKFHHKVRKLDEATNALMETDKNSINKSYRKLRHKAKVDADKLIEMITLSDQDTSALIETNKKSIVKSTKRLKEKVNETVVAFLKNIRLSNIEKFNANNVNASAASMDIVKLVKEIDSLNGNITLKAIADNEIPPEIAASYTLWQKKPISRKQLTKILEDIKEPKKSLAGLKRKFAHEMNSVISFTLTYEMRAQEAAEIAATSKGLDNAESQLQCLMIGVNGAKTTKQQIEERFKKAKTILETFLDKRNALMRLLMGDKSLDDISKGMSRMAIKH